MRYDSLSFSLLLGARIMHMRTNCGRIATARKRTQKSDEMRQEEKKRLIKGWDSR